MPTTLVPLPQPPRADAGHAEVLAWARRLMIALDMAFRQSQTAAATIPSPTPSPFPVYTITNRTTDRALDADITTIDEYADVLGTLIFEVASGLGMGTYTISNFSTLRTFNANVTFLDEMCDVLGTLADDLTNSVIGVYTVTGAISDRSYNADATSEDELADVLATFISDLQARGILA